MPDWVVSISSPPKSSSGDSPTQPHTWTPALERHPRAMACTMPTLTPSPVWLGSFQVGLHGARPSLPRTFCPVLIQDYVCAHSAHSDPRLYSRALLVCEQHGEERGVPYIPGHQANPHLCICIHRHMCRVSGHYCRRWALGMCP